MRPAGLMVLEREEEVQAPAGRPLAEPRWPDERAGTQPGAGGQTQTPGGVKGGYVLVVDDDDLIRGFIRGALEDEGLQIKAAANGRDAVALALDTHPDLMVLDIMLPDINGDEVVRQLRARYGSDLRVLVITADTHAPVKAEGSGAFAFLQKPFDLDDLVRLVREALGRSS